jgi:hypothetical protein
LPRFQLLAQPAGCFEAQIGHDQHILELIESGCVDFLAFENATDVLGQT